MPKRDRRRSRIPQPSSVPLFLVAGLPKATAGSAEGIIRDVHPGHCNILHLDATGSDERIYHRDYVSRFINTIVDFVAKRRTRDKPGFETPSFVYLFFVGSHDQEQLLSQLDFTVFPIELEALGGWNEKGRMRRHEQEEVTRSLRAVVAEIGRAESVAERWKSLRPKDALLLPPVNFQLDGKRQMSDLFKELRQGSRGWSDRFPEIAAKQFNSESLPNALTGSQVEWCFQDQRELVFLKPKSGAYHGGNWDVDNPEAIAAIDLLRSLYRFGAPIPGGFQHDAQFEAGRLLKNILFECCRKGDYYVTDSHANVYPNDFVRARTARK